MTALKEKLSNAYERFTKPAQFQIAKLKKADRMIKQNNEIIRLLKENIISCSGKC